MCAAENVGCVIGLKKVKKIFDKVTMTVCSKKGWDGNNWAITPFMENFHSAGQ